MRTFQLSAGTLEATLGVLRSFGTPKRPHEGVVLWAGSEDEEVAHVTHVIAPRARTGPGFWELEEPAAIGARIRKAGAVYLGQVHSHPPWARAVHSWGDDDDAYLKFEGMVSVVVGNYARHDHALIPLQNAGVHLFESGKFRLLAASEVQHRFTALTAEPATLIDMRGG